MLRKRFTIAGASVGILYAIYGIMAFYMDANQTLEAGQVLIELLVISVFTIPLGAVIGMGVGLLVEGLCNRIRRIGSPRKL